MKNKFSVRVFAVVLALVLVLQGSVFAATGGEQLLKHNLIQGTGNGLAEDQVFTREQFARVVCEVLGEAEAAKAYSGKLMYADADQVSDWAKPYVAYVTDKKWMSGVGDNKFHPLGIVSEAQIGAVLLRAMGYQYSWSEISVRLFAHGIAPIKSNLKRGEAFDYIWRAIRQPIGKDGKSLLERLGKMTKEELNQADAAESIR
ncbi:MAG: S-layer homology domain-containing protein, partial [Bacillota bacterium]|nr:S-layer homology domain-containing protein [Bacillota bacterium]